LKKHYLYLICEAETLKTTVNFISTCVIRLPGSAKPTLLVGCEGWACGEREVHLSFEDKVLYRNWLPKGNPRQSEASGELFFCRKAAGVHERWAEMKAYWTRMESISIH